jgi:putative aldouronate transport system permease protein
MAEKLISPRQSLGGRVRRWGRRTTPFDIFLVFFFILMSVIMIFPFWSVLMTSLVTSAEATRRTFILWPEKITLFSYRYIFASDALVRSLLVTIGATICGTVWCMFITTTLAYAVSKKYLVARGLWLALITSTMFLDGGLIPYYLLITKTLHMQNTFWVLWVPGGFTVMNFVMMKSFFNQIPESLEESARLDGANDLKIFARIVLPVSLPAVAPFSLFYAVGKWNDYMSSMLFTTTKPHLHMLQYVLRKIVVEANSVRDFDLVMKQLYGNVNIFEDGVKYATIIVATVPILVVYPFIQKYFSKGIYVGSIKG